MKKIAFLVSFCTGVATTAFADEINQYQLAALVNHAIKPLIQKYNIPGMSVGVTIDGKNYFYNYGIASKQTKKQVTTNTLFEIGSDTKTFTASLAAYAIEKNKISLSHSASEYVPALRGSVFDKVSLLNLGTQTSGLPLFVLDNIKTNQQLMDYYRHWKPTYPVGSHRVYSNMGVGLLGVAVEHGLHGSYENLLQKIILNPLQMKHTFIAVPTNELSDYAQGYTTEGKPIRLTQVPLWRETYGIKTCSTDLIRFIQANMQEIKIPGELQQALLNTHTAYFKSDYLTQDLVWEQYDYPVKSKALLAGNGNSYLEATQIMRITPPLAPQQNVWINKTGGTNGFSSYLAFVPEKKVGIVMLANKAYPMEDKVAAGYEILSGAIKIR